MATIRPQFGAQGAVLDPEKKRRMEEAARRSREARRLRETAARAAGQGIGAPSPQTAPITGSRPASIDTRYYGDVMGGGGQSGVGPQTAPVTQPTAPDRARPWAGFSGNTRDVQADLRADDEARLAAMQPPGQQYGFNPTRGGGTFEKTWSDFSNLPTLSNQLNTAPNPMQYYQNLGPQAQQAIGSYWGGQGSFDPSANSYLNQGRDYMNNAPPLPGAPGFGMNPDSYRGAGAPGYQGPSYDQMSFGQYDPSQVTGPGRGQFTDPRDVAAGIGGPQTDYERLYASTQTAPVNRIAQFGPMGAAPGREATGVARENVGPSGYRTDETFADPQSVSRRGFEAGLGGAVAAQGAGLEDPIYQQSKKAILDSLKQAAALAGLDATEDVGGRGFVGVSGTNIYDSEKARRLAPALMQANEKLAQLEQDRLASTIQQRQFGTTTATGIGGSAAGAAAEFGRLGQAESQFGGEMALRQREQDINQQGQRITERAQDIGRQVDERGQNVAVRGQDVEQRNQDIRQFGEQASRALDVERLRGENYQSQTQRMTGMGSLVNEMESARANNDVQGYQEATQRLQTEYGYSSDQARNAVAGYQAATQRGEVGQQAWAESQRLGLDYNQLQERYDELAASNVNMRNTNLVDVMRITGDQANERLRTVTGAMGDYGRTLQEGQIENMRNVYNQASMAAGILGDASQASQFWTDAIMKATGNDREAFIRMWEGWVGDQTHRNDNKFDWGGFAGDVIGGAATLGAAQIGKK